MSDTSVVRSSDHSELTSRLSRADATPSLRNRSGVDECNARIEVDHTADEHGEWNGHVDERHALEPNDGDHERFDDRAVDESVPVLRKTSAAAYSTAQLRPRIH